jgi:hypothetical protein
MCHYEIWLRSNQRAAMTGLAVPTIMFIVGVALAQHWFVHVPIWVQVAGWLLVGAAILLLALLVWYARTPRLAFDGQHLLVYLRSAGPIHLPIDVVECFFLGSGLKTLPGPGGREVQMKHLAVRLAENASEWAQLDVKPALGKWCGGTITIYGAWCEPLTLDLVRRLNGRLAESQQVKAAAADSIESVPHLT